MKRKKGFDFGRNSTGLSPKDSVGCRFKVYSGKVEIGKMPEKYDQVHILNSSSRRKQQ